MPERSTWRTGGFCLALALAAGVRLALVVMRWPVVNSDEATMGLMAWHIAEGREFPVFFYGQQYMGSVVAYAAAPMFRLVGPSTTVLRLVTIALFLGFMGALWKLAAGLYDQRVASASVLLLAFGSIPMLSGQMQADGHNATRLLAALALLLAVTLARASPEDSTNCARRRWLWAGWGLVAGLGVWADLLVVPFLAASVIVLLACSRSGPRWRVGWALGGILLGISPMLVHNLLVPGAGTMDQVIGMVSGRAEHGPAPAIGERVQGAVTVSLPMATGASALCASGIDPVWRTPSLLDHSAQRCADVYRGWGLVVLVLLALAVWKAWRGVWSCVRPGPMPGDPRDWADTVARLALIGAAAATLAIYAVSSPAGLTPYSSSRYLQAMWIGIPAVVASVAFRGASSAAGPAMRTRRRLIAVSRSFVVVALCGTLLLGTVQLLVRAQQPHPRLIEQETLVDSLLQQGITRVYTDYWTCNAMAFASREQIICAVLSDDLTTGFDRIQSYPSQVAAAPDAMYVFREGSTQARVLGQETATRRVAHIADYVVYHRPDAVQRGTTH